MRGVTIAELSLALAIPKAQVRQRAAREGWPFTVSGRQHLYQEERLPATVRSTLISWRQDGSQSTEVATLAPTGGAFSAAKDKQKAKALLRSQLVRTYLRGGGRVEDFIHDYNTQAAYATLRGQLGEVTVRTFYRWLRNYREQGISGVTPRYGISSGGAGESLSQEERNLLLRFWLRDTQPSMSHAWRLMRENLPSSRCTYQTAARFLRSLPEAVKGVHRLGAKKFEDLFLPHLEQRLDLYKSNDVWVSDHHCLDVLVRYQGRLVRPWITIFQDLRSGLVVGWWASVQPSSLSIAVAFIMAAIQHGLPQSCLFDNGQDYRSKWLNGHTQEVAETTPEKLTQTREVEFSGVFGTLGVQVRFTRTYNGKSKARTERYFRTLAEYFCRDVSTYLGSDSTTRPEDAELFFRRIDGKEQRHDVPDWDWMRGNLGAVIEYINNDMPFAGAESRAALYSQHLPPAHTIQRPSVEELKAALMKGEVRKVGRNGVKIHGISYWSPELWEFVGRSIKVLYRPADDTLVECQTLDGRPICTAQADYFVESGDLATDIQRLERAKRGILAMAERGSSEVGETPQYQTILDVARNKYAGAADEAADRFLAPAELESQRKAAGAELAPPKRKPTGLKNPLYVGVEE